MADEANATAASLRSQLEVTESSIAKLGDEDLAAIFKFLPPFERLIISEVCTKWRNLNQTPWRDVIHLDLSQVPTHNIHAVIKKCPGLVSVSALQQNLGDLIHLASRLSNITSLKCVDCTFTIDQYAYIPTGLIASVRSTSWNELIWHNSKTLLLDSGMATLNYSPLRGNPPTLRRLQMSALSLPATKVCGFVSDYLDRLPLLESCILADVNSFFNSSVYTRLFNGVACSHLNQSTRLRELYLSPSHVLFMKLVFALPEFRILYLNDVNFEGADHLARLITQHPSLRVLVITASRVSEFDGEILIPARKLFPNGFNAQPVPQLHLFLGKIAAEKLRFHPSPTDALKICPIDAPLPEFLEKKEIKPIFEGSWIASRINDGAKEGVNLADYSFEGNAESISYVQL